MVFSQLSIQLSNNVRTSPAIGKVWTAGMAKGRVGVKVTGTVYYENDKLLELHMQNKKLRVVLEMETAEGTVAFILPRLSLSAPTGSSGGNNQDYTSSITLQSSEAPVNVDGKDRLCVISAVWVEKGKSWAKHVKTGSASLDAQLAKAQGVTTASNGGG